MDGRLSTGVAGLDDILHGGLIPHASYLLRGGPGTGKTTLGLHYLAAGVAAGERCLFITMEESEARIRANAAARGIDISAAAILDISPSSGFFAEAESYDIFTPAEVEREPITRRIVEHIEKIRPERVFLDPMTQFRYLSADAFQFRRQVVSFLRFLIEKGATILFTSENSATVPDDDLQFLSDGVIDITLGPHGRAIEVTKFRGSDFQRGQHTVKLVDAGFMVFPRLEPNVQPADFDFEIIPSGIPELDAMLNGGIERGTVTLITGPSGVGKTTLGMQFIKEAAARGERSVLYCFEEEQPLLLARCDGIGLPVRAMMTRGTLSIHKIEPLRYTPDEFADRVRREIAQNGTRVVMLDSVAGYRLALRGENLRERMHALAKYLQNIGIAVIIINEQETIVGEFKATEVGLSYLADTLIFLRFLEMDGELRKAVGVLKKRLSNFEKSLREYIITPQGVKVGPPLKGVRGILGGIPELIGGGKR
ncbi:MAG: AAA family ATPase [Methylophilaceae bacterium]|nr:AAA family ATPase [Methylophilaceae bacterium]